MDAGGTLAGTEFDDIELRQSDAHPSRLHHKTDPHGSAPEDSSQAGHAAPDANGLHTILDIDEDPAQPSHDQEEGSGPAGLSNGDLPARMSRESLTESVANREMNGDDEEEVGSESSGQPDDAPDEESFLAQLQRLDHEGKLQVPSGAHAFVSSLPSSLRLLSFDFIVGFCWTARFAACTHIDAVCGTLSALTKNGVLPTSSSMPPARHPMSLFSKNVPCIHSLPSTPCCSDDGCLGLAGCMGCSHAV